jgi:hypothetical protein
MRIPLEHFHRVSARGTVVCLTLVAVLAGAAPAGAQYVEIQSFELTPFIGARLGGTFDIQPDGAVQIEATLKDAASYGFSAGVRFDDLSLAEFRWTRSTSTLRFDAPFAFLGASVGDVALNQFHADFTREFVIPEVKGLRSFLTGSLGVTHLGAAHPLLIRLRRRPETVPGLQARLSCRSGVVAYPGRTVSRRVRVRHDPVRRLSRDPQWRTRAAVPAKHRAGCAFLSAGARRGAASRSSESAENGIKA